MRVSARGRRASGARMLGILVWAVCRAAQTRRSCWYLFSSPHGSMSHPDTLWLMGRRRRFSPFSAGVRPTFIFVVLGISPSLPYAVCISLSRAWPERRSSCRCGIRPRSCPFARQAIGIRAFAHFPLPAFYTLPPCIAHRSGHVLRSWPSGLQCLPACPWARRYRDASRHMRRIRICRSGCRQGQAGVGRSHLPRRDGRACRTRRIGMGPPRARVRGGFFLVLPYHAASAYVAVPLRSKCLPSC